MFYDAWSVKWMLGINPLKFPKTLMEKYPSRQPSPLSVQEPWDSFVLSRKCTRRVKVRKRADSITMQCKVGFVNYNLPSSSTSLSSSPSLPTCALCASVHVLICSLVASLLLMLRLWWWWSNSCWRRGRPSSLIDWSEQCTHIAIETGCRIDCFRLHMFWSHLPLVYYLSFVCVCFFQ